jgi:Domain of unknown function (DUF4272)
MTQPGEGTPHLAGNVYSMALGQCYLACRAMIDGDPDPDALELAGQILPLTQETGIYQTYEPAELRLLNAPWGSLPRRERVALGWAVEGVAVMAWALGKAPLPPFDTRCEGAPVGSALGLFQHESPEILRAVTLRDRSEIERYALTYEVISWRLQQFLETRQRIDLASRLKSPTIPHSVIDNLALLDGDLAVDRAPLVEISEERLSEVSSIVRERHKAFRWLLGYEKNYAPAAATIN